MPRDWRDAGRAFERLTNPIINQLEDKAEAIGDDSPEARFASQAMSDLASFLREEQQAYVPQWKERYERLICWIADRSWEG
jgi:hypothetical protein